MEALILTTIPWLICRIIVMLIILTIATFALFGLLLIIPHKDKPIESLFTDEQKKQLDNLVNIALNVNHMRNKLPAEYSKRMYLEVLQIEESILRQAESIAIATGRCYIRAEVQALLSLDEHNNPTKDDSK